MSVPTAAAQSRAPRPLIRQRDFRLLWSGDTVSAVGDAVTIVALPLVALGLPVGAWVDRLPRRPVLLAS